MQCYAMQNWKAPCLFAKQIRGATSNIAPTDVDLVNNTAKESARLTASQLSLCKPIFHEFCMSKTVKVVPVYSDLFSGEVMLL